MITFREFFESALELILDDKRGLTPEQHAKMMEIKRFRGGKAAQEYYNNIKQNKTPAKMATKPQLPKGYVGKWNPETKEYENINNN
jgi:hypothetical protein